MMSASGAVARRWASSGHLRATSRTDPTTPLVMRIRDLAATRTRYGYFRTYILLRKDGS